MTQKTSAKEIFLQALDLNAHEVDAHIDQLCGNDQDLRQEVAILLNAHREAGGFLGGEAANSVAPLAEEATGVLGNYKLLQRLGEGGMGVVFMAEQQRPVTRQVAIKIIKPGMDSKQVVARFEAERQALAMMDHPNIAKVFDAGTTESGNPYFAMELVKGIAITDYCDENRLSVDQRLRLFMECCEPIQHAHHRGVIHRDIKPSNILVAEYDGVPVPKVIDFGVAKAIRQKLTEKTMFTQFGQLVGTVDYMAPEQARFNQLDVDTRSDVYSLGVLLYELLTGETPFDKQRLRLAEYEELMTIIRNEDPPTPSFRLGSSATLPATSLNRATDPQQLTNRVTGELDWIVMKALEKDRNRRYESANDLARDVQRFLSDDAVAACPPTLSYRLSKFYRRHQRAITVAGAFAAVLILGFVGTGWGLVAALNSAADTRNALAIAAKRAEEATASATTAKEERRKAEEESRRAEGASRRAVKAEQQAQSQADTNRRTSYIADMRHVGSLWDNGGSPQQIEELLSAWVPVDGQPDLRDFAWRLHWSRLFESSRIAAGPANAISISPQQNLITANHGGIYEWIDVETKVQLWSGDASTASLSSDGRWVLVPGTDTTWRLIELSNVEFAEEITGHYQNNIRFSACGGYLVSVPPPADPPETSPSSPKTVAIRVRDLHSLDSSWRELEVPRTDSRGMPISYLVALASDGETVLSRTLVDAVQVSCSNPELHGLKANANGNLVHRCVWSLDQSMFAFTDDIGRVRVVSQTKTGEKSQVTINLRGDRVFAIAFSPDSRYLAAGGRNCTIRIWDLATVRSRAANVLTGDGTPPTNTSVDAQRYLFKTFRGHTGLIRSLVFSANGEYLASRDNEGIARLWNITKPDNTHTLPTMAEDLVSGMPKVDFYVREDGAYVNRVSDDVREAGLRIGDRIVEVEGEEVKTWQDAFKKLTGPTASKVRLLVEKPDGLQHIVVASRASRGGNPRDVKFSPMGEYMLVASSKDGATSLNLKTGRARRFPLSCEGVAFSATGDLIAIAAQKELVVINTNTNTPLARLSWPLFPDGDASGIPTFSPNQRFLAMSTGQRNDARARASFIRVWDIQNPNDIGEIERDSFLSPHEVFVGVAFTPDGERMVATDHDGHVRIWDTRDWDLVASVRLHQNSLTQDLSPDGNTLAIGHPLGTIILFDMTSHEETSRISNPSRIKDLVFSADGRSLIATGSGINIWSTSDYQRVSSFRGPNDLTITVGVHPDDTILATAGTDDQLRLWPVPKLADIDRNGFTIRALFNQGFQLALEKNWQAATRTFRSAIGLWHDATDQKEITGKEVILAARRRIAAYAVRQEDWNEAIDQLKELVANDTQDAFWKMQDNRALAAVLLRLGRSKEYSNHCAHLIQKYRDSDRIGLDAAAKSFLSARSAASSSMLKTVVAIAERSYEIDSSSPWAKLCLAMARVRQQDADSALTLLEQTKPNDPGQPLSLRALAYAYQALANIQLKNTAEANSCIQKAESTLETAHRDDKLTFVQHDLIFAELAIEEATDLLNAMEN